MAKGKAFQPEFHGEYDRHGISGDYSKAEDSRLFEIKLTGLFSKLPMEVFLEILSTVPINSLCNCKYVCKAWLAIIKNPRFIQMHHCKAVQTFSSSFCVLSRNHLIFRDDWEIFRSPVTSSTPKLIPGQNWPTMNSCKGLVMYCEKVKYFVCNPITGELLQLPNPPMANLQNDVTGFGFDPVYQDFKVLRVFKTKKGASASDYETKAQVLTVGTTEWRLVAEDVMYDFDTFNSVLVNGALHWIGTLKSAPESDVIVSFNLGTEVFRHLSLPRQSSIKHMARTIQLAALEECLCVARSFYNAPLEIWKMQVYGVQSSWVKTYSLSNMDGGIFLEIQNYKPLQVLKNGKLLLYSNYKLACYDPSQHHLDHIYFRHQSSSSEPYLQGHISKPSLHIGSLISPKSVGKLR